MIRPMICSAMIATLSLMLGCNKDTKSTAPSGTATITKIDVKNRSLVVKMKDKDGKETDKTFVLTEEMLYRDSTGEVAAMDIFQNGDEVLVVEADGKLKELHKKKDSKTNATKSSSQTTRK